MFYSGITIYCTLCKHNVCGTNLFHKSLLFSLIDSLTKEQANKEKLYLLRRLSGKFVAYQQNRMEKIVRYSCFKPEGPSYVER